MASAKMTVKNILPVDSISYGCRKFTIINASVPIECIQVIEWPLYSSV